MARVVPISRVTPILAVLAGIGMMADAQPGPPAQSGEDAPAAADLAGRVDLRSAAGSLTPGADTVVWLPGVPARPEPTVSLESRQKRFAPHVLAVARGTEVSFPNVDPIYHNVFSRSEDNGFDLGLYRRGASRSYRFDHAGLVRVYCNIHPDMAAYVMVVDDAAFAVSEADGSFDLPGVRPGAYVLHLWNERSGETSITLTLGPGERRVLNPVLEDSGQVPKRHKNKHGRDYPPVTEDLDRY